MILVNEVFPKKALNLQEFEQQFRTGSCNIGFTDVKHSVMDSIPVGVRLPENLHQRLLERSEGQNVSKSQIMIEALQLYLDCDEQQSVLEEIHGLRTQFQSLECFIRHNVGVCK